MGKKKQREGKGKHRNECVTGYREKWCVVCGRMRRFKLREKEG